MFGLCGDHIGPIFDACASAGPTLIDARDERGAAFMAEGQALSTGLIGVVCVTGGPGLTNAVTALADAQSSGIPLVCITGGVSAADRGLGHPGDIDQIALVRPVSKWAATVNDPDEAGEYVAAAFGHARSGRPGVAILEIPLDVQQARASSDTPEPLPVERHVPDRGRIATARAILAGAERPIAIAGSGAFWSDAGEALRALVERTRIPLFTLRAGRGLVADDHELCLGFPNPLAGAAPAAYAEADAVLVIGTKLDLMLAGGAFNPQAALVRVDVDPAAFATGRKADVELVGDARAALEALAEGAQGLDTKAWVARLREAADERARQVRERGAIAGAPMHPGRLVAEVAAALPPDAVVCVDAGELALWAVDALEARRPGSLHLSLNSALGALGMGVPWAVGAKSAHPDRPVLALVGDGSFGLSAMELDTAARHGLPVTAVVGNDGGWGMVRHIAELTSGRASGTGLPGTAYERLAEAVGGHGERVEAPESLAIHLANALAAQTPSVINAILDPTPIHEATKLIAGMFART
jgi:acetolactate synthase-1/2/3 large subunit